MFDKDEARFFVGEVLGYDAGTVKVNGYSFVREMSSGQVLRKDDPRIKIISIVAGAFLFYQLPNETDVHAVQFKSANGEMTLTDGKQLQMNLSEMPHSGHI